VLPALGFEELARCILKQDLRVGRLVGADCDRQELEREFWDDYMKAYEDALSETSADNAPWFIVPANKKWFRNYVVARTIVDTLEELDMKYPNPSLPVKQIR